MDTNNESQDEYFYSLFYYHTSASLTLVYCGGHYKEKADAVKAILKLMEDPRQHFNNSIVSKHYVGWINECKFGEEHYDARQPHNPIHIDIS